MSACASLTPDTKDRGIAFTIIGPFFVGFIELAALSLAPLFCKAEELGVSSGMLASIRAAGKSVTPNHNKMANCVGGSIAVAVYSTVLTNRLGTTLPNVVGGAAIKAGLPESDVPGVLAAVSAGTVADAPGVTSSILAAIAGAVPIAYSQAFKTVYLASLGFGGIAIIGSLLTVDPEKHLTDTVERKLQIHGGRAGGTIETAEGQEKVAGA